MPNLNAYCQAHSTPLSPILYELERETHLKTLAPQMLSGPLQGQLLRLLSLMIRPRAVLEIGTFTGYSAICLAQGLAEDGILHTIEVNEELAWFGKKYFAKAGLSDRIVAHIGDALTIVPTLPETFDLVFLDAGKHDYVAYFDLVIDRLRPGGWILTDNVLWDGKVAQKKPDKDALYLDTFNKKLRDDPRVEYLLLPIRDGLGVVRKV